MMNAVLVYSQPQPTTLFAFDYVKELRKDEMEQSTLSITSGEYEFVYISVRLYIMNSRLYIMHVNSCVYACVRARTRVCIFDTVEWINYVS